MEEAWNNEASRRVRKAILKGELDDVCICVHTIGHIPSDGCCDPEPDVKLEQSVDPSKYIQINWKRSMIEDGLYCSGGHDWFSIGSEGNVYKCNDLIYREESYLGNIIDSDIVLSKTEFTRCPVQRCQQVCDRHWSRKRIYQGGEIKEEQDIVNREAYHDKTRAVSILWAPTWKCNYTCSYCHLPTPKEFPHIKNACNVHPYESWIKAFDRFFSLNGIGGGIIHTNGGEPLFYKGIDHIFHFLYSKGFEIAITTNLSVDIYKIISKVPVEGIGIINASLHPTDKNFRWELFKSRVLLLKEFGYSVAINFVAHPDQIMLIPEYHEFFTEKHGIELQVIPMVAGWSGVEFGSMNDYPEPLKKILDKYVRQDLQDENRFIDGHRITEVKSEISLPVIDSPTEVSSVSLPVLKEEQMPNMNDIRTIGYKDQADDVLSSEITQELHDHIDSRLKYFKVSDNLVGEWLYNRKLAIQERNERKIELECSPLYVDVEYNIMCNLECEFCFCVPLHIRDSKNRKAKLTIKEIDKLSPVFKYAEIIETSKAGEPFVTPELFIYGLDKIRKSNPFAVTHTVTNCTALNKDIVGSIVEQKLDHMYVSISGDNRDTYKQVMGRDQFDRVIENIKTIQEAKKSAGSREPYIHFNTQLCSENDPLVMLDLAKQYGVIEINFIKTQGTATAAFKGKSAYEYMSHDEVEAVMDRIVEKANQLRIAINFSGWDTKHRDIAGHQERFYYPYVTKYFDRSLTCPTDAPWFRYCTAMRKVQPCCWSPFNLGDWTVKPFEKIWNGPLMKKMRRDLSSGKYPDVCHCLY